MPAYCMMECAGHHPPRGTGVWSHKIMLQVQDQAPDAAVAERGREADGRHPPAPPLCRD